MQSSCMYTFVNSIPKKKAFFQFISQSPKLKFRCAPYDISTGTTPRPCQRKKNSQLLPQQSRWSSVFGHLGVGFSRWNDSRMDRVVCRSLCDLPEGRVSRGGANSTNTCVYSVIWIQAVPSVSDWELHTSISWALMIRHRWAWCLAIHQITVLLQHSMPLCFNRRSDKYRGSPTVNVSSRLLLRAVNDRLR